MRIEFAKLEDLIALVDIKAEAFGGRPHFYMINDMLPCIRAGQCYKVTSAGEILGGAELARNDDDDDDGYELCSVFVARTHQGRGAGSALVRTIAQIPSPITVKCRSELIGFYVRTGFVLVSEGFVSMLHKPRGDGPGIIPTDHV